MGLHNYKNQTHVCVIRIYYALQSKNIRKIMPVLRKFVSCFVILLFINACYELWAIGRT